MKEVEEHLEQFTALYSMARMGSILLRKEEEVLRMLQSILQQRSCRYSVANALIVLERMGSNKACMVLLQYLKISRWCPMTTESTPY